MDIIKEIQNGLDASFSSQNLVIEPDRRIALQKAYRAMSENDILLVAGKGHENTQTDRNGTHHFSDQEELRKLND